jgi:CPA2 family monovalent cation:H+ antiporter-2
LRTPVHLRHSQKLTGKDGSGKILSAPFLVVIYRVSRTLGARLAAQALPVAADGKLDLATAPRRALLVTLQLACVLAAGLPIVALTQPFVPSGVIALRFWLKLPPIGDASTCSPPLLFLFCCLLILLVTA